MRYVVMFLVLAAALLHAEQLPKVTTETLAGNTLDLPSALSGRVAVLCIGFTHASQSEVKAWSTTLRSRSSQEPGVDIYSVAVLEDAPRLIRGMIVHSIKSSEPPADYSTFLIVNKNEKELKQAVGFGAGAEAYVVVLDPAGAIEYKLHGPPTAAAERDLNTHISEIRNKSNPQR
jgi:ATP10 protein